jgi:pimeloyl-ACP methyl ester carboxylesterase
MTDGYATAEDGVRLYYVTSGSGPELIVCPNGPTLMNDLAPLAPGRTVVCYDPRNRGRSDPAPVDRAAASDRRGVHDDVRDLEAVRRHFGAERMTLIGHSYVGLMVVLYASIHPSRVMRIVQLSPSEPEQGKVYPPELMNADSVLAGTLAQLGALQAERARLSGVEFCRRFWSILTPLYVANPEHVDRIRWARCEDEPNAMGFNYWIGTILPSLRELRLTAAALAAVTMPVLIVHGRKDRSAPYGGARDWAALLPDARLITVDDAAHAPWLEAPDEVMPHLLTFTAGLWPPTAEMVR